jgi:hypothetical protein
MEIGDRVKFTESGEDVFGHLSYYEWPYLYSAVRVDGHVWTVETNWLLPA